MKKGFKHSEETKTKIRLSHIGIKRPGVGGRKKGSTMSTETKKLMSLNSSQHWLGKKRPDISDSNHYLWNGKTPLMEQIRKCVEYFKWRSFVFERDNYTCIECNTSGIYLHADHIKQFAFIVKDNKIETLKQALDCVELWDTDNGRTLCKECHRKIPAYSYDGKRKITFVKVNEY